MFSTKSSLHHICGHERSGEQTISMVNQCIDYLLKSKRLRRYTDLVDAKALIFDASSLADVICKMKRLDRTNKLMLGNLLSCLECLRIVNVVHVELELMRLQAFDIYNENHTSQLEKIWLNLKGEPRTVSGFISQEWVELGFQGENPSTDFRAMGYLGLYQLHYFTQNKQDTARLILTEWSHPTNLFPFAIIGINLTRVVVELFKERRFHRYIFQHFGYLSVNSAFHQIDSQLPTALYDRGPSNDSACIEYCADLIHRVYCIAFEEFYLVWVIRKPSSIMCFNDLLAEVKDILHDRYPMITTGIR